VLVSWPGAIMFILSPFCDGRKNLLMERGPEIFSQKTTIHDYERRIRELERLIGHKEVEIALLKNFLTGSLVGRKSLL